MRLDRYWWVDVLHWIWTRLGWAHDTVMAGPDDAVLVRKCDVNRFELMGYKRAR
jgi:hypothetical protein